MSKPTLYLVDGSSYIFRAFFAVRPLSNSKGLPTNALYGFTQMLLRLIREEKPSHLIMVFDSKEPTEREEIYPEYKANRDEPPDDLIPQFPYFQKITESFGIPTIVMPGVEADDIIGTIAKKYEADGGRAVIVTGDKDLMQLVSDRVTLLDTMKEKRSGIKEVQEKFGVPPEEVVEVMALCGDASDNIPGVRGVGPKTATELIRQFHTVENVYENLSKVKSDSVRKKLEDSRDNAMISRNLVEIRTHIPVKWSLDASEYSVPRPAEFAPLFQELEFTRLLREMSFPESPSPSGGGSGRGGSDPLPLPSPLPLGEGTKVLATPDAVSAWARALPQKSTLSMMVVLETPRDPIVGVAISVAGGETIYIPTGHQILDLQVKWEDLAVLAKSLWQGEHLWWGYDVKPQLEALHAHGLSWNGRVEDGLLMKYVLGGSTPQEPEGFLQDVPKRSELLGPKRRHLSECDVNSVAQWAGQVVQGLLNRLPELKKDLKSLLPVYADLELPLLYVLMGMEEQGVLVDMKVLSRLSGEFGKRLKALEQEIHGLADGIFNIQSPKQLAEVLFGKMQLPVVKRTKTGPSTDVEVLSELAETYPIAQKILDYRSLAKLISTYVEALPQLRDPKTGRIHTTYNQAVAATGRLSSSDPNLQNIPIRSEDGRKIRAAFVAPEGSLLVSADYSQIELRILAHMANEPLLIEAFQREDDVHGLTAAQIFNVAPDQVSKEQRAVGKTVNFAVLYGQGAFSLAKQLNIPLDEAKRYIENYFSRYSRVATYRDQVLEKARETGYVETLFGRRRQVPDIRHGNKNLRSMAERMAFNTVFQGTAADIMKRAMLTVARELPHLIMQVHDELVVECPKADVARVSRSLKTGMESAAQLKVPLTVDVASGKDWSQC